MPSLRLVVPVSLVAQPTKIAPASEEMSHVFIIQNRVHMPYAQSGRMSFSHQWSADESEVAWCRIEKNLRNEQTAPVDEEVLRSGDC